MDTRAHKQQAANHERAAEGRRDAASRFRASGMLAIADAHEREAMRHECAANEHREEAERLGRGQKRAAYGDAIANRLRRVVGGGL